MGEIFYKETRILDNFLKFVKSLLVLEWKLHNFTWGILYMSFIFINKYFIFYSFIHSFPHLPSFPLPSGTCYLMSGLFYLTSLLPYLHTHVYTGKLFDMFS